jgi:hypothetical protein
LFQCAGALRGGRNYGLKSRDFPRILPRARRIRPTWAARDRVLRQMRATAGRKTGQSPQRARDGRFCRRSEYDDAG